MKFCLRGLLGKEQCQTLFKFLDALADLCSEEQNPSKIQLLEDRINLVCALMERDFPVSLPVQADKLTLAYCQKKNTLSICISTSASSLISSHKGFKLLFAKSNCKLIKLIELKKFEHTADFSSHLHQIWYMY